MNHGVFGNYFIFLVHYDVCKRELCAFKKARFNAVKSVWITMFKYMCFLFLT